MASGAIGGGVTGWGIGMACGAIIGLTAGMFLGLSIAGVAQSAHNSK
jgi:hypothetical protein